MSSSKRKTWVYLYVGKEGGVGLGRWAVEGQIYMYTYIPIESIDTAGSLRAHSSS